MTWILNCLGVVRDLNYEIQTLDHMPSRVAFCWFLVYLDFLFTSGARKLQCCSCALTTSCLSKKPLLCSHTPPSDLCSLLQCGKDGGALLWNILPPAELSLDCLEWELQPYYSYFQYSWDRAVSEWMKKCSSV